jgi:hypothetical protein
MLTSPQASKSTRRALASSGDCGLLAVNCCYAMFQTCRPFQSIWILAFLTTFAQRARSFLMICENSSGRLPSGSRPSETKRECTWVALCAAYNLAVEWPKGARDALIRCPLREVPTHLGRLLIYTLRPLVARDANYRNGRGPASELSPGVTRPCFAPGTAVPQLVWPRSGSS